MRTDKVNLFDYKYVRINTISLSCVDRMSHTFKKVPFKVRGWRH